MLLRDFYLVHRLLERWLHFHVKKKHFSPTLDQRPRRRLSSACNKMWSAVVAVVSRFRIFPVEDPLIINHASAEIVVIVVNVNFSLSLFLFRATHTTSNWWAKSLHVPFLPAAATFQSRISNLSLWFQMIRIFSRRSILFLIFFPFPTKCPTENSGSSRRLIRIFGSFKQISRSKFAHLCIYLRA